MWGRQHDKGAESTPPAAPARHDLPVPLSSFVGREQAVAEICDHPDGLLLAIELAAVRVRLLHPAALLARLDSRLSSLVGGPAHPARRRPPRETIRWSYELLTPVEQRVFRGVAVIRGQ